MPPHDPPWNPGEVRDLYAAGTWAYALGRPAWESPDYKQAVRIAETANWNPWWIRTFCDARAVLDGCYMDESTGRRVVQFKERFCRQSKGEWAGKPLVLMDWQKYDLNIPVYGWKKPDHFRRFEEAYIEVPKKNGKSTEVSSSGVYLVGWDGEPGAEVYAGALDSNQSRIVFGEAARMIRKSPELRRRLTIIDSTKRITYPDKDAWFAALSAEVESHEGLNIHAAFLDETHVYKNSKLYDTLRYGGEARRQPLMICITTAGVYDPIGFGWTLHEHKKKIADGMFPELWSNFVYICAASKDDDWKSQSTWIKANPSWGVTINPGRFAKNCTEAEKRPSDQNTFKRYRLNIWTQQRDGWLDISKWEACEKLIDWSALKWASSWLGLDLSMIDDLTALAQWVWPQHEGDKHKLRLFFWLPEECIYEKGQENQAPYAAWVEQGFIEVTEGNYIDHQAVRRRVSALRDEFNVLNVQYDSAFASSIVTDMQSDGATMVKHGQNATAMNPCVDEFERILFDGNIEIEPNPVAKWHFSNAMILRNTLGHRRIIKAEKQKRHKVDGVIASLMALGGGLGATPDERTGSTSYASVV